MSTDGVARWVDGRPNLEQVDDFQGLKSGDRIQVLWAEGSDLIPAEVIESRAFGALVRVDTRGQAGWSCDPFEMYVTQQCHGGAWSR